MGTRHRRRDGAEPSRELRRSHCDQANLQASALYSQRPRGEARGLPKSADVSGSHDNGGSSVIQLLLTPFWIAGGHLRNTPLSCWSHRYPDSDFLARVHDARSLVVPCLTACFFSSTSSVPVVWATLLAPLGAYHRVFQNVCVRLEPSLQWLDFSVRGYMMSNPIDNQCK